MENALQYQNKPETRRGDPLLVIILAAVLAAGLYARPARLVELFDELQPPHAHAQSVYPSPMPRAPLPSGTTASGQPFGHLPRGPKNPTVATRPASWPGGSPAEVTQAAASPMAAASTMAVMPAVAAESESARRAVVPAQYVNPRQEAPAFEERIARRSTPNPPFQAAWQEGDDWQRLTDATIIAKVGAEVILAADVIPHVNEELERRRDQIPPEQIGAARVQLIHQRLTSLMQTKLVYNEVLRKVPEENLGTIRERTIEHYEKTRLSEVMKKFGVTSQAELDAKLRQMGTSFQREREAFVQQAIASSWARQNMTEDEQVSRQEMLEYYRANIEDYRFPAKSHWQQLTIRYDGRLSKKDAWSQLAQLGNQVLDGAPFENVAMARSSGFTANKGGHRDWTTQDSLVSKVLDEAIFHLPVGQLSPILDDGRGAFHIVRVVERKDAGQEPFLEAQVEIRKKIRNSRQSDQYKDYVTALQEETPIWTIFDSASR